MRDIDDSGEVTPRDPEQIRRIENQTQVEVETKLSQAGVPRGGGLRHYVNAKRAVFERRYIDESIYDRQQQWLQAYLGI